MHAYIQVQYLTSSPGLRAHERYADGVPSASRRLWLARRRRQHIADFEAAAAEGEEAKEAAPCS